MIYILHSLKYRFKVIHSGMIVERIFMKIQQLIKKIFTGHKYRHGDNTHLIFPRK